MSKVCPSTEIWNNIQNGNIILLLDWITEYGDEVEIEAKHPQYKLPLLYHAARNNNIKAVKLLLEKKANINSQDSPVNSTALHISSFLGFTNIVKYLLENKGDPTLRNRHGETAIENGHNGKNSKEMIPIYQEWIKNNDTSSILTPDTVMTSYPYLNIIPHPVQTLENDMKTISLNELDEKATQASNIISNQQQNDRIQYITDDLNATEVSNIISNTQENDETQYIKNEFDNVKDELLKLYKLFDINSKCTPCTETIKSFLLIHSHCTLCNCNDDLESISGEMKCESKNESDQIIKPLDEKTVQQNHTSISNVKEYTFNMQPIASIVPDNNYEKLMLINKINYQLMEINTEQKSNIQTLDTPTLETKEYTIFNDYVCILNTQNWKNRLDMALQIAELINKFHNNGKIHGNICCDNIITKNGEWALHDADNKNVLKWYAPELTLIKHIPSIKADVFSFAFILYVLWHEEMPWNDLSQKNVSDQLCLGIRPEFSVHKPAPDKYRELIENCWHQDAKIRPSMDKIISELKNMSSNITPLLEALLVASSLPQGLEKYKIIKFISSTFTCLIQDKTTKEKYVMKIRRTLTTSDKYEEEHKILLKLNSCDYIMKFHEGFLWDFQGDWGLKWCLVYTFYNTHILQQIVLTKDEGKIISEKQIINWCFQLIDGLEYLHNNDIVHQNVNVSKIFIDEFNIVKLGDVGLTKEINNDDTPIQTKESNIRSLGIVILTLLTLNTGIQENDVKNSLSFIPKEFNKDWHGIIKGIFDEKWHLPQIKIVLLGINHLLLSNTEKKVVADLLLNISTSNNEVKRNLTSKNEAKRMTISLEENKCDGQEMPSQKKQKLEILKEVVKEGKFKCDYPGCTKAYQKKYTLNRHKKTHLSSSAYICRWCSKPFVDNSSLSRHERSHSGWKPFACPYKLTCGKRFTESNNLKQHIMRKHDGIFQTDESQYEKRV